MDLKLQGISDLQLLSTVISKSTLSGCECLVNNPLRMLFETKHNIKFEIKASTKRIHQGIDFSFRFNEFSREMPFLINRNS